MLHFQYFFAKIKTQTFSLILFGAFQEKKLCKNLRSVQKNKNNDFNKHNMLIDIISSYITREVGLVVPAKYVAI